MTIIPGTHNTKVLSALEAKRNFSELFYCSHFSPQRKWRLKYSNCRLAKKDAERGYEHTHYHPESNGKI